MYFYTCMYVLHSTASLDYTHTSQQLAFVSNGLTEECIDIGIIDDRIFESNETFVINLRSVGEDNGMISSTIVKIIDDDLGENACNSTKKYIIYILAWLHV